MLISCSANLSPVRRGELYPPPISGRDDGGSLPAVDLSLSPEHELLRRTLRDFLAKEVEPIIEKHEKERRFPIEIVNKLGEMGMLGIPFPEEEGGAGLDTLAYAIAVDEMSRVWGSLGIIVAAHT